MGYFSLEYSMMYPECYKYSLQHSVKSLIRMVYHTVDGKKQAGAQLAEGYLFM